MAVNTILIDFSMDPSAVEKDASIQELFKIMEKILLNYLSDLKQLYSSKIGKSHVNAYQSDRDSLVTIRIFNSGLITINLEYFKLEEHEHLLSYDNAKQIERDMIEQTIGVKRSQAFVPIKRCTFDRFFPSSDERLLEYDIDRVVFEERSAFQKVQIVHSKSLGNMLVLDDLQNISESDLIYTETLMARGKENYKDKEIVILGGGDGALLYELLKEKPKNVIMLEIDDVVMNACAKHMRSICGDVLDKYNGPNYEIIVGDCNKALQQFISDGKKFDYVFGDLTDIPISTSEETNSSKIWEFIIKIQELSFKILKKDGKFMTHGNGTSCQESLMLYEAQLKKLQPPVVINKSTAFVPSFLEDWVFYQISFANNN